MSSCLMFGNCNRGWSDAYYEIPFYTRNISDEEKIYRTAKNTLNMYNQQTELAKMGGDAVFGMPGKVGTVLRAGLAAKGAYDVGYGAGLAYNGDKKKRCCS